MKDYSRIKSVKVLLVRTPFGSRQFLVRMNGQPWSADGRQVSRSRVVTALHKVAVRVG